MSESIRPQRHQVAAVAGPADAYRQVFAPTDIAQLMSQAPWWVVSLVIHGILLILLALIDFTTPRPPRDPVEIISGLVEVMPPEKDAYKHIVETVDGVESETVEKAADKQLETVSDNVAVTHAPPIGVIDVDSLIAKTMGPLFDPNSGGGKASLLAPSGAPRDYIDVVDALAREILGAIQKEDLLVVLLFDESKSLLEDRKLVARQIRKTIEDLKKEMQPKERTRLKWAMVSYAKKPTLWLQPTSDLDKVVAAADNAGVDTDGEENVIEAINFTMKNLGPLRKPMFLVLVTDEEGDDVTKTENVNTALQTLAITKTRLFVFGRESNFQLDRVREWLRDKNGERMGPWGYADRGLESCDYEFFQPDWFWNGQYSYNGVPSGFGCWVQSMLAHQTGGTYFMLSDVPPKYDDDLMKDYAPEWEPRNVYEKRTEASRVRSAMAKLFREYAAVRPTHWLTKLDRIKVQTREENKKAQGLLRLVDKAIDELEPLKSRSRKEKFSTRRWQANYDLTMAQLCKLKFEAHEYIEVTGQALKKGFPKAEARQKFNLFSVYYDHKAMEARSGRRGDREMAKAKEMLTRVVQDHKGTPWAEVAAREMERTMPLVMKPVFYVEPTRPRM